MTQLKKNKKENPISKYRHINNACILLYKKEGYTPLEALEFLKNELDLKHKVTYAGRLDPMAKGYMHIIHGEKIDTDLKNQIQNQDKIYKIKVITGIKSDTDDFFGIIKKNKSKPKTVDYKKLIGPFVRDYPTYSSPIISNSNYKKKQDGYIYDIELLNQKIINVDNFQKIIQKKLNKAKRLKGFRNNEIEKSWKKYFENNIEEFIMTEYKIKAKSGTYMRTIANDLGGITLDIERVGFIKKPYKI